MRVEERVWFLSEGTRLVTCSVRSSLGWLEGKREKADRQVAEMRLRGDDLTQRAAVMRSRRDDLTQRVVVMALKGGRGDLEGGGGNDQTWFNLSLSLSLSLVC